MGLAVYNTDHKIDIFVPVYNEEKTIGNLIYLINDRLAKIGYSSVIWVVDDGSIDLTAKILDEIRKSIPNLHILRNADRIGIGDFFKKVVIYSSSRIFGIVDADGQYDVEEFAELLEFSENGKYISWGYRPYPAYTDFEKLYRNAFQKFIQKRHNIDFVDPLCRFLVAPTNIIKKLSIKEDDFCGYIDFLKYLMQHKRHIVRVPVNHYERIYGKSRLFPFSNVKSIMRKCL